MRILREYLKLGDTDNVNTTKTKSIADFIEQEKITSFLNWCVLLPENSYKIISIEDPLKTSVAKMALVNSQLGKISSTYADEYDDFENFIEENIGDIPEDKLKEINDEDKYWTALQHQDKSILEADEYLIKNKFFFNIGSDNHIAVKKLLNYVKNKPRIAIAGGYPTIQHMGLNVNDFPNSDIDVFILRNPESNEDELDEDKSDEDKSYSKKLKKVVSESDVLADLVQFLDSAYGIEKIYSYTDQKSGVFNITLKDTNRTVQIIGTKHTTIAGLLNGFDSSHCKCCVYMNDTYITYDAQYAKLTKTAMFYRFYPKFRRIAKAQSLGLQVAGNPIFDSDKVVTIEFEYKRSIKGMIQDFTPLDDLDHYGTVHNFEIPRIDCPHYRYVALVESSKSERLTSELVFPTTLDIDQCKYNCPAYVLYPKKNPTWRTGPVHMTTGGLRTIGRYFSEDAQCMKFFIPIDEQQNSETHETMSNIDKNVKERLEEYFNTKWKASMDYTPLVRRSVQLDNHDDSDENDHKKPYDRISVKIPHKYNPNTHGIALDIYVILNGVTKHITQMDELRESFVYGCTADFELYIEKFWIRKETCGNLDIRSKFRPTKACGYALVCKSITISE